MAQIFQRLKALYQKEGGAFSEPIVKLHWPYKDPNDPTSDELAKEMNGYVLEDVTDPNDPTKIVLQKGKLVVNFSVLRDDGKTACRLLDLLRLLQRGGQQHGPPRHVGPRRRRRLSRNGRGPGRSIGASFTTAPLPTSPASRGIRAES